MTYRKSALACRSCPEALVDRHDGDHAFQQCPRCGGVWAEPATMAALVARGYERHGTPVPDLLEFEDGSPRHACPVCATEMHSVWLELLRFERCDAHGLWWTHALEVRS
jgi:Zn-finger nucleic acid-binding protein